MRHLKICEGIVVTEEGETGHLPPAEAAFERVKIARHPERPYTMDLVERLFTGFTELHGDRRFSDDPAIVCGYARYRDLPVVVVGQQKGRDTKQRRFRNFGMPKPEGYRKALRIMEWANKFGRPILTFIDTPGAYPGIDAEERGQAEAIAFNLFSMSRLSVPIITTILGEGGSGGALAIGVGDVVLMLENSVYSVITPEGCAAILWKDSGQAVRAAESLKLTAKDLLGLRIIDKIIPEPSGGAHVSVDETAALLDTALRESLAEVVSLSAEERLRRRYSKLRALGY
ncbi:MAG TPA: acetyl-CoA carboxylase carboxyltransferase subunit alpha [Pyrinomonadaceae bacterium]|nr:acetyl-CoA carboxylase carboxyltransferase subunit alpha [Pyrinomonadaceae bacterium]